MCAFNAGGKQSLLVHAVTKKHKYKADGRKGRVQGQVSVVAPLAGDTDEEDNNMNSEVTEEEQGRPGQAIAEVGEGRSGGTVGAAQKAFATLQKTPMTFNDQCTKAEITWTLKTVELGYSFSSSDDIVDILKKMDPKSDVFKKMSIKRHKVSRILTHGLHPHYMKQLVDRVKAAPAFLLGTDGGTFKLQGLSKLVDLVLR